MPKVTKHGSTSTIELDSKDVAKHRNKGKAKPSPKGHHLSHVRHIHVTPSDNGGALVEVHKKEQPSKGRSMAYMPNEPDKYTFEDGKGVAEFMHGLFTKKASAAENQSSGSSKADDDTDENDDGADDGNDDDDSDGGN